MKRNYKKLILAVAVVTFAAGQSYPLQAADAPYANPYAPPGYSTGYSGNPPQNVADDERRTQPYQSRPRYRAPGNYNPGYTPPYYGNRNYRRGGRSMPWESRRGDRRMPWESGRGGRNMPWDSDRGGWMSKDKFSDAWDDMLNAPSDMGEMPGGWTAPSVSVPNPVDVGDEFEDAARDTPDQMRNVYDDNRRSR